jgi:hypothetical protein
VSEAPKAGVEEIWEAAKGHALAEWKILGLDER